MNDSKSKINEIAEIRLYQDNKPYRDLDGESLDTTYYLPQDWSQFRKDLETWKNGKHTHTIKVRIGKIDEEGVEFEVNRDEQAEQKDTETGKEEG